MLQRMQLETRNSHIRNRFRCVEAKKDIDELKYVLRTHPTRIVVVEEAFQPLMSKGLDHT